MNELLLIYQYSLQSRYLDNCLRGLFGEGRIPALFSGHGTEMGPALVATLLEKGDYLIPHYRGFSALIAKGIPVEKILAEKLGKKGGTAQGIGDASPYRFPDQGALGHTISLGGNFAIAIGAALAIKLKKENKILTIFFGDGEASRTTFGSALNLASFWRLPILFVCLNNGISIDTYFEKMSSTKTLAERGKGYDVPAETISEKNFEFLLQRSKEIIDDVRKSKRPFLLEILQKRFVPHSSEYERRKGKYRDFNIPPNADPLVQFESFLQSKGIARETLLSIKKEAEEQIYQATRNAESESPLSKEEFFSFYHE